MVTRDNDDDDNKRSEGKKRCFDLLATLLLAYGDDEIRARRGREEQERNMLMIHTITSAATNMTSLLTKRKIDDDHDECKNQENTASSSSSLSLVEFKRRRVESNDEPIRAEPIREIKPPVRERKGPVKGKEPVRREPGWLVELIREKKGVNARVTPGWLVELMKTFKGEEDAKMIFEKVMTKTDLTPNQGRLLMPFQQMSDMDFLTNAELMILEEHYKALVEKGAVKKGVDVKKEDVKKEDVKKGVDVILLHRSGNKRWKLNMRIWEMRSSFNYALCAGWNQVVRDNNLQRNQTITLWSFHSHDGTLYFAFDPPTQDEAMAFDPFVCEKANRRILPKIPRERRTPRVCVQIITSESGNLSLLEGGLDLNRTPPPECTKMDPYLEAVQGTSQESLTETSIVSVTDTMKVDLELRL
ncbi:hypothetical protein N665_0104s0031 [Sinapis alba]|nr:hypothetical protein N665_0104s0031 [Sinapis alba]